MTHSCARARSRARVQGWSQRAGMVSTGRHPASPEQKRIGGCTGGCIYQAGLAQEGGPPRGGGSPGLHSLGCRHSAISGSSMCRWCRRRRTRPFPVPCTRRGKQVADQGVETSSAEGWPCSRATASASPVHFQSLKLHTVCADSCKACLNCVDNGRARQEPRYFVLVVW